MAKSSRVLLSQGQSVDLTNYRTDGIVIRMRYAVLGDIHSNLNAFEAVLRDLDARGGFDVIWCLGDVVGYGPDPHECVALLQQYEHVCVAGNHDWAAVERIDVSHFNADAALANRWTGQHITENDREYLEYLPPGLNGDGFTLVHGSPREPIWEYLFSIDIAKDNFDVFTTPYCFVGHSHIPLFFEYIDDTIILQKFPENAVVLLGDNRLIINPGSVGQPRDHDPRASYALYDSGMGTVHHYRVEYDIAGTQQKMREKELPDFLIERLEYGW